VPRAGLAPIKRVQATKERVIFPTRRDVLAASAAAGADGLLPGHFAAAAEDKLEWKLLTKKRTSSTQGVPPGKEALAWVTNTVTLIYGKRAAVLVDTFLSEQHSNELVDWVVESGKNLTTIYVTHAHGDHFFGLRLLLDKFPNAKAIATASVVAASQDQITPEYIQSFWEPRFPGQLPSQLVAPEILEGDTFYLEGEELKVVQLGHTDTSHTTALHVPSIGLVISGERLQQYTPLSRGVRRRGYQRVAPSAR
jgi:Metallo-beta-lactamase superfamily